MYAARHAQLIVIGLSFHCSDKGIGDALRTRIEAVPEAIQQSQRVKFLECWIYGESDVRRL